MAYVMEEKRDKETPDQGSQSNLPKGGGLGEVPGLMSSPFRTIIANRFVGKEPGGRDYRAQGCKIAHFITSLNTYG